MIKAAIESYLDSIVEESVEIQGMSRRSFLDDKVTLNMAKRAALVLLSI
jgi:hypothetical protein